MVNSISNYQDNQNYLTEQQERNYLIQDCGRIATSVRNYCSAQSSFGGRSSGCNNMIRSEISDYLRRVNTRASINLLNEFERNSFPGCR